MKGKKKTTDRVIPFPNLWQVNEGMNREKWIASILKDTYNIIAGHFDQTRRKPWPQTIKFSKHLKDGQNVLDGGCGNGRNSIHLAEQGMNVCGVDLCQPLLDRARNNCEKRGVLYRCQFIQGDLLSLPFSDSKFDAAVYIASLHHLPTASTRLKALGELRRVLKDGGEALVSVWKREQDDKLELLDIWKEHPLLEMGDVIIPWTFKGKKYPRYYHLFKMNELAELLKKGGLLIEDIGVSGMNIYAIVRVQKCQT